MDPTTTAHSSAIHPSTLHASTAPDGTPILSTRPPTSSATATGAGAGTSTSQAKGSSPAATGLRQRVNNISSQLDSATDHPAVKDAKKGVLRQVDQLRQVLGRYRVVVEAERRTGVDRVLLVVGGVVLYLLLIPLNLFGLALPTTQLLTFLPPSALALRTLDKPNDDRLRTLLSYFVVFGFVQFAESLMSGFLERKIPQYYTVKLLFLTYLIHPRTKGAQKIHQAVLRPLLASAQGGSSVSRPTKTPPSSKPSQSSSSSSANSPTSQSTTIPSAPAPASGRSGLSGQTAAAGGSSLTSGVDVPLTRAGGFSGTGPSATADSTLGGTGDKVHLPSGGGVSSGLDLPKY